jgi:hypothetical protein
MLIPIIIDGVLDYAVAQHTTHVKSGKTKRRVTTILVPIVGNKPNSQKTTLYHYLREGMTI